MIVFHHPDCLEYATPGHPERPARVADTMARLRRPGSRIEWREAGPAGEEALRAAHTAAHLARLEVPRAFDADTAHHPGIERIARLGAGGALAAMEQARAGRPAFCLMRPPGHHACADRAMGFCYLNNIAVAALAAQAGGVARVAVWDFDAHHGNGTEEILRGREGLLVASVHQHPGYPGTGAATEGNCLNFPVVPGTPAERHVEVLRRSWEAVLAFAPELVLVSAGFDAYRGDPITELCLERDDFLELGSWIHQAALPAAAVLEGGYSDDLPGLVEAFLEGWAQG